MSQTTPGWYGKLPTLGDFASRRLAGEFIEPWDLWLGEGLAAHRAALGEGWLDAYLASPVWRYLLLPGVLPKDGAPCAWAGVLMPSVDKVGRYFPLTIAAPLAAVPRAAATLEGLLGWLHRLEDLAVDAMHDDWSIEQLDDALAQLPSPLVAPELPLPLQAVQDAIATALAGGGGFVDVAGVGGRSELAALLAALFGGDEAGTNDTPARGIALWLADNPSAPRLLVSRGLPAREDFVRMMGADGCRDDEDDDDDRTVF